MPARVLITSAGSGVSRAVLAVLAARHDDVATIGINSQIEAVPALDRFHLVPPLADDDFLAVLCDLLAREQPDLVIAGRDDDVVVLSELADAGVLPSRIWTGGGGDLAVTLRDKATAHSFARDHDLAFVDTVAEGERQALQGLLDAGGPWLGKPRRGHGSRGVTSLHSPSEVTTYLSTPGRVVQPRLHPVADENSKQRGGIWEADAQVVIGREGEVLGTATFAAYMVDGVSTRVRPLADGALSDLAGDYARVLAEQGWRGPVNVQAMLDDDRCWRVIEINPRFSGGCLHRYRCGFDEVGIVLSSWLGID